MDPKVSDKPKRGLRSGYSTGACSAAAARAAMVGLVTGQVPASIESLLPNQTRVVFEVATHQQTEQYTEVVVIKDAGDDPDVTDKAQLTARLRALPGQPGVIQIEGGEGVGTVTLPGLGLEIGRPAINPVPLEYISKNVLEVGGEWLKHQGVEVCISVPGGEKLAKRTLNGRLGIVGGISILGTSGLVRAFSTAAFRACVVQGVEVAASQGLDHVVLTTGGRTEKFMLKELTGLPQACFVQMGDFLGAAMDTAQKVGIHKVSIGAMVGKLTKIAQGERVTHARRSKVNTELLATIAIEVGATEDIAQEIRQSETARFAAERMGDVGLALPFYQALAEHTLNTLHTQYPDCFTLEVKVCDFEGNKVIELPLIEPPTTEKP